MIEPPKKLWYNPDQFDAGPVKLNDHEVQYVRADIVDELVEALEELMYARTDKSERMATAALAKVKGESND